MQHFRISLWGTRFQHEVTGCYYRDDMKVAICAAVILALAVVYFLTRRKPASGSAPESIVLFLKQPREIDSHLLAEILSQEAGTDVEAIAVNSDDSSAENFVMGAPPRFVIRVNAAMFMFYSVAQRYTERSPEDPELRRAVAQHNAWVSMDFMDKRQATRENRRLVGHVLAHFADSNCAALYFPPTNTLAVYSEDALAALRSDDPIAGVFGVTDDSWVPSVDDDDPRLKAAESEARRRFPEFEEAFRKKAGTRFMVKSVVASGGHAEHIWIEVEQILPEEVTGRLANEPNALAGLKMGSSVRVDRGKVEDWVFFKGDVQVGGFTDAVVLRIQEERKRK
jgi:uncharacterized protein YegJ (DUF2314 family)